MRQTTAQPPYTIPGTIQLRPRTVQFFIDNLPLLTLDLCGYVCAGMDEMENISRNLGYVIAMLPDMFIGLFTGNIRHSE